MTAVLTLNIILAVGVLATTLTVLCWSIATQRQDRGVTLVTRARGQRSTQQPQLTVWRPAPSQRRAA